MPIYGTITGFAVGTFFWVITGFPILPIADALIIFAIGCLTIWATYLYFKVMTMEEASTLILLFQTTPILTFFMAYVLLGERISHLQFAGFMVILFAVSVVSVEKRKIELRISQAFWLMLLVNAVWSFAAVLIKFAINANSFSAVLSYESWGIGIGGTILYILFPTIRNAFNESIRTVRKKALVIMFTSEFFFVIAKSVSFFAYSIGAASLVSVVGSTQVFFGIAFGYILTSIVPHLVKEDISRNSLYKKTISAALLFIGLWMVYK